MNIIKRVFSLASFCDFLVFIAIASWTIINFNNWITNSEFWPVTLSGHWELWKVHPALIYKLLFHLSLSWVHLFSFDSDTLLLVSRGFYLMMGAHAFAMIYGYVKRRSGEGVALLALLNLLSMSVVFSSVGSIRSDFLAVYISIIYICLLEPRAATANQRALILGIWSLVVFMITPKSIYLIFAFGIRFLSESGSLNVFRRISYISLTIIIAILIYYFWNLASGLQVVTNAIVSAYKHHVQSISSVDDQSQILIIPLLKNDIFQLLGLGIFSALVIGIGQSRWQNVLAALVLVAVCFLHSPKLPFFVSSYLLMIFLLLCQNLTMNKVKAKGYILGLSLIFSMSYISIYFHKSFYFYSNQLQLETIHRLEKVMKDYKLKSVDGLGLVPNYDDQVFIYIGPFDYEMNMYQFQNLKRARPDMIIYSNRFIQLEPEISQLIRAEYKAVGPGYWLRNDISADINFEGVLPAYEFTYLKPNQFRSDRIESVH